MNCSRYNTENITRLLVSFTYWYISLTLWHSTLRAWAPECPKVKTEKWSVSQPGVESMHLVSYFGNIELKWVKNLKMNIWWLSRLHVATSIFVWRSFGLFLAILWSYWRRWCVWMNSTICGRRWRTTVPCLPTSRGLIGCRWISSAVEVEISRTGGTSNGALCGLMRTRLL